MSRRHTTTDFTSVDDNHSPLFTMLRRDPVRLIPVTIEKPGLHHLLVPVIHVVCYTYHINTLQISFIDTRSRPHCPIRKTGMYMHVAGKGNIALCIRKEVSVLGKDRHQRSHQKKQCKQ